MTDCFRVFLGCIKTQTSNNLPFLLRRDSFCPDLLSVPQFHLSFIIYYKLIFLYKPLCLGVLLKSPPLIGYINHDILPLKLETSISRKC